MKLLFVAIGILYLGNLVTAQPPSLIDDGRDISQIRPVQPESPVLQRVRDTICSSDFRTLDGSCTNSESPERQTWGRANRPQFSYFGNPDSSRPTGGDLLSPRLISNILSRQTRDIFDSRRLSEITTFFGQFIDHTLAASPIQSTDRLDIELPEGDSVGEFSERVPFFRSQRVRVNPNEATSRPQNSLSSVVDLNNVYGPSRIRNRRLRTLTDGKMRTGPGNLMPLNDNPPLFNAPNTGRDFFLAGDHRSNEHPILTALHAVFLREHNAIVDELKSVFPNSEMDDELMFNQAKKINEAQWQKIVFEEWYPALTGKELPRYRGFQEDVETTVSVSFSTAAFRVGHTLVGNQVNRAGPGNARMTPLPLTATFFRSATMFRESGGIEPFLRGAINNRAQKVDLLVVDALRDFLFTGITGESDNVDLIALNLQRGRDHNVPSYNELRERFRGGRANSFRDITRSRVDQAKLIEAYATTDRVEAWPGLVAEDHAPGSSIGPTLNAIFEEEFTRLRDGDRFFFRREGIFTPEFLNNVPRVQALFRDSDLFRTILLRNTDITPSELPRKLFFA